MRILSVSALLILLLGQRAFAAGPNSVVIAVDPTIPGAKQGAELRAAVATRVLAGFESFKLKLTVVSDPKLVAQARDCKDAACLQEIAKAAELGLVVQVGMQARKPAKGKKSRKDGNLDYTISMVVARDVPDRRSWKEKTECSDCSTAEAKQAVFLLSATLGERISAEVSPSKSVPVSPPAPPRAEPESPPPASKAELEPLPQPPQPDLVAQPAPPPAAIVVPPPAEPTPQRRPEWYESRTLSIAAMAGGVAAMGTGIYLLHLDGEGTCDLVAPERRCPDRYDTQGLGAGFLVGGGLAALGGLASYYLFTYRMQTTQTTLGFTGTSISVSGAF